MKDYATDRKGYYRAAEYKRTRRKFRPLAFDSGEMIIDSPEAAEIRAWWRSVNHRDR